MFLVFIFASVSVMFMKLSNDAFEERERYLVMRKLGFAEKTLEKSISKELGTAYILPFIVMVISAYFSVHALERVMHENFFYYILDKHNSSACILFRVLSAVCVSVQQKYRY